MKEDTLLVRTDQFLPQVELQKVGGPSDGAAMSAAKGLGLWLLGFAIASS